MISSNYQNKHPLGNLIRVAMSFLIALLFAFNVQAQTTVTIGSGAGTSSYWPNYYLYDYSYTQQIVYASEMTSGGWGGGAGIITKIKFLPKASVSTSLWKDWVVYLGNTSKTDFSSTTDWVAVGSLTEVFNGEIPTSTTANVWMELTLSTPFYWDGTSNIVVAVDENYNDYGNNPSWAGYLSGANRAIRYYRDNTDILPSAPPAGTLNTASTNVAQIQMEVSPTTPCTAPPTAGTSNAVPSSGLCLGNNVVLSLTGNSSGMGQTYQWQESTTIGGPYTNVGVSSGSSVLNILASGTKYYQCEVTCSGNSQISTPVQVTVNPSFPGGNYTINSALPTSGSNFQTFNDFKNALDCGIAGAVVANVVAGSGPYNEQVEFGEINGTSSINTITINGNGNVLTYGATVSTAPGTLVLNGTDYMTVNNLTVEGTGTTYALVCHLWNNADNNAFNNCTFNAPANGTSTSMVPFSISGSATSGTASGNSGINNIVTGCTMFSGYYNTAIVGNSSTPSTGNQVINCNITDQYLYGLYCLYQDGVVLRGNTLSRPTRTTLSTYYGIYLSTGISHALIEKNKIRNTFATNPASTSIQSIVRLMHRLEMKINFLTM